MKKVIPLCLLLICVFFCARAAENVQGVWYLTEGDTGTARMSAAEVGMEMTLTLAENGKYTLIGTDMEAVSGTWTQSGQSVCLTESTGAVSLMNYAQGRLSIEESGVTLYFERELSSAEDEILRRDAALSEFSGMWQGKSLLESSGYIDLSALDMAMAIQITEKQVDMTLVLSGEKTSGVMQAAYENGELIIRDEDMACTLSLRSDGTMVCEMNQLQFILERDDASAIRKNALPPDFEGEWQTEYVLDGYMRLPAERLSVDMHLAISHEQAQLTLVQGGVSETLSWEYECADGMLQPLCADAPMLYLHENEMLSCQWNDMTFYLLKNPEASSPAKTDAVMSDFNGEWTAVYGMVGQSSMSMADMNLSMHLVIANDRVEIASSASGESSVRSLPATLQNGVLTVIDASDGTLMDMRLHESGQLSCTVQHTVIFFERNE